MNPTATVVDAARIAQAHQLYCQLTGQCLTRLSQLGVESGDF